MMAEPFFSCVVPVKGDRPFLKDALSSLWAQGLGNDLEIIVQDADVENDLGQSDGINKGFAKASGKWFFWLNADDMLLPNTLSKVRKAIEEAPKTRWVCADTLYIDSNNRITDASRWAKWRWCYRCLAPVWSGGPSAFFNRELWSQYGGCRIDLRYVMDIDLWTRWARRGEKFIAMEQYAWAFRRHKGSLTGNDLDNPSKRYEYYRMLKDNGLHAHRFAKWALRIARFCDGSIFQQFADGKRLKGKNVLDYILP